MAPFLVDRRNGSGLGVDQARLLEALVLFDEVVLESYRLQELPSLLAMFGPEGLAAVLASGALKLQVVPHVLAEGGPAESPTVFRFLYVTVPEPAEHMRGLMPEALASAGHVPKAQLDRLEERLHASHTDIPSEVGTASLLTLYAALTEERPILRASMELVSGKPPPENARFSATKIERATYNIDPPWTRHLPVNERRRLVQQTLLGVGKTALRVEKMRLHHALTGFSPPDLSMFDAHLRFLEAKFEASRHATVFRKIVEVSGVPTIDERLETKFVDVDALLRLRAARETHEFRSWLWSMHDATDKEIKERIRGFGASASRVLSSKTGKTIRWLASTGIGLIPGIGTVAGAALGAADTFLLEHLFPQRGVVTFLDGLFPSLFARHANE